MVLFSPTMCTLRFSQHALVSSLLFRRQLFTTSLGCSDRPDYRQDGQKVMVSQRTLSLAVHSYPHSVTFPDEQGQESLPGCPLPAAADGPPFLRKPSANAHTFRWMQFSLSYLANCYVLEWHGEIAISARSVYQERPLDTSVMCAQVRGRSCTDAFWIWT